MPFTFKRFKQDKFQRFQFPIRALVCAISLFWLALYLASRFANFFVFLLGLATQAAALYFARIKYSNWHVRLCLVLTEYFLQTASCQLCPGMLHLVWFNVFTFTLGTLIPLLYATIDALLVYVWYEHMGISLAFSLVRYFTVPEQTLGRTFCEFLAIMVTTAVFGFVERQMKEEWVLFDSFKRAQKIYMKLIDQMPVPTFVTDSSGRVIYNNSAGRILYEAATKAPSASNSGHNWNFLELVYESHRNTIEDMLKRAVKERLLPVEVPLLGESVDEVVKEKDKENPASPANHIGLNTEIIKKGNR